MNNKHELTRREWATYNLIKANSEMGLKTTQQEIVENYKYDPLIRKDGYKWNDDPRTHDHCSSIWIDIERINFNYKIEKIIIADNFIYHLAADESEVLEFAKQKYLIPALRKLKRHYNIVNKVNVNGRYKLIDNNGKVFTENSKARHYIQTFVNLEEVDDDLSTTD